MKIIDMPAVLSRIKTFLCIGAFDGLSHDDNIPAIMATGATGIFVEPVPEYIAELKKNVGENAGHRFVNWAIHERSGLATMIVPDPQCSRYHEKNEWSMWCGSSCLKENARNNLAVELGGKKELKEIAVQCRTFADFAEQQHVESFDYLQIDAEGNDAIILEQIDLRRFGVLAMTIETMWLRADERTHLCAKVSHAGFLYVENGTELVAARMDL